MPQHDVAGLLQRGGEDGVLIAGRFEVSNFFHERRWIAGPHFRLELSQGFEARVALGCGKGGVEGNDPGACGREALDQAGVRLSREGEGSELLQGSLVDAHNHDAIIVRPRAAQSKAQVEGTELDILEKEKPGATIAADTGKGKQEQAGKGDQHGQHEIDLAGRDLTQSSRPSPFRLRYHPGPVG